MKIPPDYDPEVTDYDTWSALTEKYWDDRTEDAKSEKEKPSESISSPPSHRLVRPSS
jgi:hypothetical protein